MKEDKTGAVHSLHASFNICAEHSSKSMEKGDIFQDVVEYGRTLLKLVL
jgi:hypothetical protein